MKSEKDSHIISKILEQSTHLGDYIRQERKKRGLNQTEEEIAEIARSTNQKNHNRGYLDEVSNQ